MIINGLSCELFYKCIVVEKRRERKIERGGGEILVESGKLRSVVSQAILGLGMGMVMGLRLFCLF